MCFSATSSFVASAVLITTGSYCVKKAAKKDRDFMFFAAVPIFFGIQQLMEGFVWIGINNGLTWMVNLFSFAFLFFAFGFWPFYAPYSAHVAEKEEANPETKALLWVLTIIGLFVGAATYLPLLLGKITLSTTVVNHSISYATNRPAIYRELFTALYLLAVIPPFLVINHVRIKIFGFLLIASVLLSDLFYRYAFDSVWCFFSALLSLFIVYIIIKVPVGTAKAIKAAKRKNN
jgi:hypothetical protein